MDLRHKLHILIKNSKWTIPGIILLIALSSLFDFFADNSIGLTALFLTFFSMIFELFFLTFVLDILSAELKVSKTEIENEQIRLEKMKIENENEQVRLEQEKKLVSQSKASMDDLLRSVSEIIENSGIKEIAKTIDQPSLKRAADSVKNSSAMIENNPVLKRQIEIAKEMSDTMNQVYPFLKKNDEEIEKDDNQE